MEFPRYKKLAICLFALIFLFFMCVSWVFYNFASTPLLPLNSSPEIFKLDRSATATQFVAQLEQRKLTHSPKLFLYFIRFKGLTQQLKAGVYQINPGETPLQILHKIATGEVLTQNFAIIEGTTLQKVSDDLLHANYLEYHPDDWLLIKNDYSSAEGLLLADTYQYRGGSTSKPLILQAHQNLMNYLQQSWSSRDFDLPYATPYEMLIAASIIEKETAKAEERKLISGVMVNRLKKKMPLQMDPTVIYALGSKYKGQLSHQDLLFKSPYNSYIVRGLPPTPIAMVGRNAIDAAAHPQKSNYFYFVAKGDGTHQFSETYTQQKQAIQKYQKKDY